MKEYEIDEAKRNKYWDNGKPFWKGIISMAGDGRFDSIVGTLIDKCELIESDARLMAQWFLDNFKTETPDTIQKGMNNKQCK